MVTIGARSPSLARSWRMWTSTVRGVGREGVAPDPLEDLVAGQRQAAVADQVAEQLELAGGELHRPPFEADLVAGRVDREAAQVHGRLGAGLGLRLGAAEHRLDAGDQLARRRPRPARSARRCATPPGSRRAPGTAAPGRRSTPRPLPAARSPWTDARRPLLPPLALRLDPDPINRGIPSGFPGPLRPIHRGTLRVPRTPPGRP